MRVLRAGGYGMGSAAVKGLAVRLNDEFAGVVASLLADARRVGAHVGNEADGSLAASQIDAFVKALSDLHRAAHPEPELARGLLLQRGGRKRRRGVPPNFALLNRSDAKFGPIEVLDDGGGFVAAPDLELLAAALDEIGRKDDLGTPLRRELGGDRPILFLFKRRDLAFAVDDQFDGNRLHAARRKTAANLRPQQRRNFIADETIEDPPRLLGVHEIHVDGLRVLERG